MPSNAEISAKKIFGQKNIGKIELPGKGFVKRYKIVVFVPPVKTEELIHSLASAGAGVIGNYTNCSFRSHGTGSFMGNSNSNPLVGSKGRFETVEEDRLEMICNKDKLEKVIDKLYEVHPYDEPAFDVYEVISRTKSDGRDVVTVTFNKKTSLKKLLKKVNPEINLANVPQGIKKIKVKRGVVDCSESNELLQSNANEKTLYIKLENKNIKAYLI